MRKCSRCKLSKELQSFYLNLKNGYYHSWCKECQTAYNTSEFKHYYLRSWHLKTKFGLSQLDYQNLLKKQDNGCAVCSSTSTAKNQSFHVDHDHTTGRIRGLLCHNCNRGIGYLKDNPALLLKAAIYLK